MFSTIWARYTRWGLVASMAWASMSLGCAHVISDAVRTQAEPAVPFAHLRANPNAYQGRTLILGGEILDTTNLREGTRLEILQKPLGYSEAPQVTDNTGGRFIAMCEEYLDPAVYAKGRRITVAGRVLGSYTGKVGEVDYIYPLISCQEIYLWPRIARLPPRYDPYDWWYGPPYPYLGYSWHPFYRRPFWHRYR
jgi:outer membrane lipoprotein